MNHIKIIFSDFNMLIWFSSDNRVYKESFISEDLEKTLLKYLNLIYKEKQETLTKSFIKSLKKMINIENGVMTINQNRTWYRQVNDIDYKKIKTLFLNNSEALMKDLFKQKSIENNNILKDIENSLKQKPEDDYLIFKYGIALAELGKLDDAIDNFREAISINDNNPDYFYYLSLTYRKLNKLDLAIMEMISAINKSPDNYLYLRNLAEMYYETGKYKNSLEIYSGIYYILEADPDDMYDIQMRLGDIYNKLEYYEDAILLYEDILSVDKHNAEAQAGLDEALKIKRKITSADINNLGIAYAEKNKYDKAIEKFKKAIEINSTDAEFYFNLAMAYKKNNMLIQASIEFKNVLKYNSKIYEAHFELGEIYQEQNNISMAIEEYKKFIEISNDLEKIEEAKKILNSLKIY